MEIFHENILKTFIFCFLASLGIIQIMVGRRGWHGLSIYGGRARRNVNYAMGAGLIIFAYAWYFSNPEHRNMRNIEGFMSLACLVLGIAAAALLTAALASAAEALRRRWSNRGAPADREALRSIPLMGGMALLSRDWGVSGENLIIIAEPGTGSVRLLGRLYAELPVGRGFLSILPLQQESPEPDSGDGRSWEERTLDMLNETSEMEGLALGGETFIGLGWGSNALMQLRSELEGAYRPRALLAVAPVIPDYSQDMVGDALISNTPLDILDTLMRQRPWSERAFRKILRLWLPVLVVCVFLLTVVTFLIDIRWKLISGPLVGLVLSLWITYFLAAWRGPAPGAGGWEAKTVSRMQALRPVPGGSPLQVVITSEDPSSLDALPAEMKPVDTPSRLLFWRDVLRGKFLLKEGTLSRLVNLIVGDGEG
jgi:hypothetical protein